MAGIVQQLVHQARRTFARDKVCSEELEQLKKIVMLPL